MSYKITVDGERNAGLQVWLMAMRENAMDFKVRHESLTMTGAPVRVSMPGEPEPEVTIISVDIAGRPIAGGMLRHIKIEDITEVAVW